MPLLTQKSLILAKVETTVGTDAVPVATTDAFLVENPMFSVAATDLERNFARPDFSSYASRIGMKIATISFSVPLAGSATTGVAPTWGVLFRGCAMTVASLTVPTRMDYTPITTPQETMTIYCYYEGLLHKVLGCVGTWSLQADAGGFVMIQFTFQGVYTTPINSTYPGTVTLQDVVPPQVELASLSYGGDATLIVKSFKMDMGNKVVHRPDVNSANGVKAMRITGRDPKGGFDPETEQNHTFWTQLEASTLSAFTMTIGTVLGNKMIITLPKVQILGITYGDRDNLRVYDLSLIPRRNTGNDEITISFQ